MFSIKTQTSKNKITRLFTILTDRPIGDQSILNEMGQLLVNKVKQNFTDQGVMGKPWKPLSPVTLERRRHRKINPSRSTMILVDTGMLRDSISYSISGNTISVRPTVSYGKYHELGIGVPRRPFMPISKTDLVGKNSLIGKYLLEENNAKHN